MAYKVKILNSAVKFYIPFW